MKLPKHIMKDAVKWLMMPSKFFLTGVSVWPETQNVITKVLNYFYIITMIFFLIGQLLFNLDKKEDLGSVAYAISMVILSIETTTRRILCLVYKKEINAALQEIYYKFWDSNCAGIELHRELSAEAWRLAVYCLTFMGFSFIWALQAIILTIHSRKLPLSTKYPFDWWEQPYYELLYVWQSFITMELVFNICGIDFFFASLLLNCVAQFKLLRINLRQSLNAAFDEKELIRSTKRHYELIRSCKKIDDIFSYFILVQYLTIIGAVCLSSFVSTAVSGGFKTSLSYGLGHIFEIFIFCYLGETIIMESSAFSEAIYECGWHLCRTSLNFQKSMIMMMIRAQRPVKMSAGGFGYLSLSGFLKIVQFSFSVYTLLRKMMEKQNNS